jgi:hypothetical protein
LENKDPKMPKICQWKMLSCLLVGSMFAAFCSFATAQKVTVNASPSTKTVTILESNQQPSAANQATYTISASFDPDSLKTKEHKPGKATWTCSVDSITPNNSAPSVSDPSGDPCTWTSTATSTQPGTWKITYKVTVEYEKLKKTDDELDGTFGPYEGTAEVGMTAVGVDRVEFKFAGDPDSNYAPVPDPLVVLAGSKVTFRAISKLAGAPWPAGQPKWSGTSGASGTGATVTVPFGTVSKAIDDYKTVVVTCGNKIEKNVVVVEAELEEVSFSGDQTVRRDEDDEYDEGYKTQHWLTGRTPKNYPIAYTSGKSIKADVTFKCNPEIALTAGVKLAVRGQSQSLGFKYSMGEKDVPPPSGTTFKVDGLSSGNTDSSKVDYAFFTYEWQIKSTNAQFDWRRAGASTNKLYITLHEAKGSKLETMYELACKNKGATTDAECITNTWASFSGRDVKAWSDHNTFERKLYYYSTKDGDDKYTADAMLKNPNNQGQCHAWADLYKHTLEINGIVSRSIIKVAPPAGYDVFGVKNIGFSGSSPYRWGDLDVSVKGIPGQNMETPKAKLFGQHFIVRAEGKYYDPSYGATATDEAGYSNDAVDALYRNSSKDWHKRSDITPKPNLQFSVFP